MIRVQHVILPAGLTACVRRDARGEIEVFVAVGLEPARVRSAVRTGLRSYGTPGWRGALLPVLLLLPLTGGLSWLRALARLLRAHAIGAAAAATGVGVVAATSAVLIVSAPPPQQHAPAAGPAPTRLHHRSHQRSPTAQPATTHQAVPSGQPASHHRSQSHQAGSGSRPAPSHPAQPSPAPSPSSSSGSGSGGGGCVRLLGLSVCL